MKSQCQQTKKKSKMSKSNKKRENDSLSDSFYDSKYKESVEKLYLKFKI